MKILNSLSLDFLPIYLSLKNKSLIYFSLKFIDVFIMFMPTIGYLDIIRIMVTTRSPAAFNYNTCFILMSAHGLKILYRIYHPYAARIFGQSVTQFSVSFIMAYLKYYYSQHEKLHNPAIDSQSSSELSSTLSEDKRENPKINISYYFNMAKTRTFLDFMISFFLYASIILFSFYLGYNFISKNSTVDTIGIIANLIDSTISIPTFIKIVFRREINNVSTVLILQFVLGDMMKLALFILSKTPASFIAGACLQLTLDLILFANFLQLYFCNKKKDPEGEELIRLNSYDNSDIDINIINITDDGIEEEEEKKEKSETKETINLENASNAMASDISTEP